MYSDSKVSTTGDIYTHGDHKDLDKNVRPPWAFPGSDFPARNKVAEVRMTPIPEEQPEGQKIVEVRETTCCIVGGGPAGLILATLLARKNVPVLLLEQHLNFDRDFRGDTVHPSTLEVLDQLGWADGVP